MQPVGPDQSGVPDLAPFAADEGVLDDQERIPLSTMVRGAFIRFGRFLADGYNGYRRPLQAA
jgi:hypothetical protein